VKKLKIFGALPKDTDKEKDLTDTISPNTNNKTKEKDQNKIVYIHKKFLLKIFLINFLINFLAVISLITIINGF